MNILKSISSSYDQNMIQNMILTSYSVRTLSDAEMDT